jgi:hypothetical protein
MFAAFGRSYRMFSESLAVLRQDKTLLFLPALSGICTIVMAGMFIFAELITGALQLHTTSGGGAASYDATITPLGYAFLFAWYFASWTIILFFNVAIIHCAKSRFDGKPVSANEGLRCALQHAPRILAWAFVTASVGVILEMVADKNKIVGGIVKAIVGAAWAIATFFIVPVMIYENLTLYGSFRRSIDLIRKSWGEAAISNVGTTLFIFLAALPALALPVVGGVAGGQVGALAGTALMVGWWIFLGVVSSAITGIMRAALYNYAATGVVPAGMSADCFEFAFKK